LLKERSKEWQPSIEHFGSYPETRIGLGEDFEADDISFETKSHKQMTQ
jgi:hypothetical protein